MKIEITDLRDGLYPSLRQTLSILQTVLPENRFQRSSKVLQTAADALGTDVETIYDTLVDTTWPRCKVPLIDGHGMFGFPVAYPEFSEIRLSAFCMSITNGEPILDFNRPLSIPFPYVLVSGTLGYANSISKIPTHNLGEVIDAAVALMKNPKIETEELLRYIKGPDLLFGGAIENFEELHDIYESGNGVIKVIVTPKNFSSASVDDVKDYGIWYEVKTRKVRMKDAFRIEIPYRAFLNNGEQIRFMSLKEILLGFIDHWKYTKNLTYEEL